MALFAPGRPRLGPRLAHLLAQVRPPVVWDLGCDHGHLALRALSDGLVERAVLVDRSRSAMAGLSQLLDERAPPELRERARLICADAARLPPEPVEGTVVVAGLGARAILRVLEGFVWPNARGSIRLVLQPEVEGERLAAVGLPLMASVVEERGRRHDVRVGDVEIDAT